MKNEGKKFEEDFQNSIPDNIKIDRLKDPSVSFNIKNQNEDNKKKSAIRFSGRNPYDYILYRYPNQLCLELKTTSSKSFSYKGCSPKIQEHQIKGLLKASKYCDAGFILNFRNMANNNTYYISIENFLKITSMISKKSINENDIKPFSYLISNKIKRTRYKYDIDALMKHIRMKETRI